MHQSNDPQQPVEVAKPVVQNAVKLCRFCEDQLNDRRRNYCDGTCRMLGQNIRDHQRRLDRAYVEHRDYTRFDKVAHILDNVVDEDWMYPTPVTDRVDLVPVEWLVDQES